MHAGRTREGVLRVVDRGMADLSRASGSPGTRIESFPEGIPRFDIRMSRRTRFQRRKLIYRSGYIMYGLGPIILVKKLPI